jgi:uncharacterized protein (DUF1778 family)
MPPAPRTTLLIRCSEQQADLIRKEAAAQHRTISGYLLNVLERSLWIESKFGHGLESLPAPELSRSPGPRTAMLLHCSTESAEAIRRAATKRTISISRFALFSLERQWRSLERLGTSPGSEVPHLS